MILRGTLSYPDSRRSSQSVCEAIDLFRTPSYDTFTLSLTATTSTKGHWELLEVAAMFNYGASPYGSRPPGFSPGGFPGAPGGPSTSMGAPPGMSAPGVGPPPGIVQAEAQQPVRPGGFPSGFQPPANMPNINFSAPVIRLGTSGPSKAMGGDYERPSGGRGNKPGLGSQDTQRDRREQPVNLVPPTKDEIAKTIFIGGITEGAGGDEGIERILASPGGLRRWTRAVDADGKACRFGFAEYEDSSSLAMAIEVLKDIEVPIKPQVPGVKSDDAKVEKSTLLVSFATIRSMFLQC
jgi:hypothetical protein